MNNFQYIGVMIDNEGREKLLDMIKRNYPLVNKVLNTEGTKTYLHHCTLLHKSQVNTEQGQELLKEYQEMQGTVVPMDIVAIGTSDKVVALLVGLPTGIVSNNLRPHITVCTFDGGKPVDSNEIEGWYRLHENVSVNGTIEFV